MERKLSLTPVTLVHNTYFMLVPHAGTLIAHQDDVRPCNVRQRIKKDNAKITVIHRFILSPVVEPAEQPMTYPG